MNNSSVKHTRRAQVPRISIEIYPTEKRNLKLLAAADGRSFSAMARVYMVRGMKADPLFNAEVFGEKQS